MQKFALIVAGGKGERMKSELPKQFMTLSGKPMLMHTLEAFSFHDIKIILVLPELYIILWEELCKRFNFGISHIIAPGGELRFDSVRNGLALVPEDCLVAIHDGARPLVSEEIIEKGFNLASIHKNAIPCITPSDSVMIKYGDDFSSLNRDHIRLVQTPQIFYGKMIKDAYANAAHKSYTDDASVCEANGESPFIYEGENQNIKITNPIDFRIAEIIIEMRKAGTLSQNSRFNGDKR